MDRLCLPVLLLTSFFYQDTSGQVLPADCLQTGCGVHGVCVDYGYSYRCSCAPGFEGTSTKCVPRLGTYLTGCKLNPCINGVCVYQSDGSSVCRCREGFVNSRENSNICVPGPVNCPSKPCTRGRCVTDSDGRQFCQCYRGYRRSLYDSAVCEAGTSSSRPDDCTTRNCENGVCTNIRGLNKCVCMMGYELSDEDKYVCKPIDQARNGCHVTGCTNGVCVSGKVGVAKCICKHGYQLAVGKDNVCIRKYFPLPSQMGCDVYGCTSGYCTKRYGGVPYCQCYHGYQRHPFNRFQCIRKQMQWADPWSAGDSFMSPLAFMLLDDF